MNSPILLEGCVSTPKNDFSTPRQEILSFSKYRLNTISNIKMQLQIFSAGGVKNPPISKMYVEGALRSCMFSTIFLVLPMKSKLLNDQPRNK